MAFIPLPGDDNRRYCLGVVTAEARFQEDAPAQVTSFVQRECYGFGQSVHSGAILASCVAIFCPCIMTSD